MKKKKRKPLIYNGHSMSFNELYYINGGKKIEVGAEGHSLSYTAGSPKTASGKLIFKTTKKLPIRVAAAGSVSTDVLADYVELDFSDPTMQSLILGLANRLRKGPDHHEY